jgi:hypothetical protein
MTAILAAADAVAKTDVETSSDLVALEAATVAMEKGLSRNEAMVVGTSMAQANAAADGNAAAGALVAAGIVAVTSQAPAPVALSEPAIVDRAEVLKAIKMASPAPTPSAVASQIPGSPDEAAVLKTIEQVVSQGFVKREGTDANATLTLTDIGERAIAYTGIVYR